MEIKWKGTFDCSHCGLDKPCEIIIEVSLGGDYGEIKTAETMRVTCINCGYSTPILLPRGGKQ